MTIKSKVFTFKKIHADAPIDFTLSSLMISKKVKRYFYKFTNDFKAKYLDDHRVAQKI
jgi:hypothetical protein